MKTRSKVISLYRAQADYMTLTSWNREFYHVQTALVDHLNTCDEFDNQVAQYVGKSVSNDLGSIFAGDAVIKGRRHYIAQISGELANENDVWGIVAQSVKSGMADVTRLDVQMTIPEPAGWSQVDFFNDRKAKGKTVGWAESTTTNGQNLQTVYVGARTSGRFLRLYEKIAGDTRLLRCEYEIKRPYSDKWGRQLFAGSVTIGQILRLYVEETRHKELIALYMPHLHHLTSASKVKVLREDNKTEKWLLEQVLPVFIRTINEHGASGEVVRAYAAAIERHKDWGDGL